jgi:FkbM family methyltransferase
MSIIPAIARLQWVEIALSRVFCALVPTRCMIDVGAHHGTSLEPFLHGGWEVVAFEPIEDNRRQLAAAFPGAERLTIRSEAVSDTSGTQEFHLALNLDGSLHEYHHSLERIGDDAWHKKGPTVAVPTVSLDDLVARGDIPEHVGFLKIDTEGHDLAVLRGAARLTCDVISVEFWGDGHALGKSPSPADAMISLVGTRGYDSYIAICHDGAATSTFDSSVQETRPDSWGNLVFFKNSSLFRQVSRHRDWLFFLEMARHCDSLMSQLVEKEAVIQKIASVARQRLDLLTSARAQLHKRSFATLGRRLLRAVGIQRPITPDGHLAAPARAKGSDPVR